MMMQSLRQWITCSVNRPSAASTAAFTSGSFLRRLRDCAGLSPKYNIRCFLNTTAVSAVILTCVPFARAQPSAGETMQAYRTVETWIRSGSIPTEPQLLDPPNTTAASVTLRLAGRVMGRATVAAANDETSLWEAARRAWIQAAQRLPVQRDALRRENLLALTPRITIDIQLAGEMTPIVADTLDQAAQSVSPGRQGVAARIGRRIEAVFPGFMLSTNKSPAQGLSIVMGALGLPPTGALQKLQDDHDLILYRFDVQHLAQRAEGQSPIFLTRGGRVAPLAAVTPDNLRRLGNQLAANLINRQWPGDEPFGLMGTYNPWLDKYEKPRIATPLEQALAAFALARWSHVSGAPMKSRDASSNAARHILAQLSEVTPEETPPSADVAASSMIALAYLTLAQLTQPLDRASAPMPARAPAAPVSIQRDNPPIAPPIEALRTFSHAMTGATQNSREMKTLARGEVRKLFSGTPIAELPALMPWLGLAELALLEPGERVPSAIALREFRDLVEQHQISLTDVQTTGDDDLAGGIVFTQGVVRLPTWQSIRPLIFLATMLGDDRLTDPDERAKHLVQLLSGLRFVMQLAVDEPGSSLFPAPQRAVGGVRLAVWDNRQPVQTTAMALVLIAETLDSVEKITGQSDR